MNIVSNPSIINDWKCEWYISTFCVCKERIIGLYVFENLPYQFIGSKGSPMLPCLHQPIAKKFNIEMKIWQFNTTKEKAHQMEARQIPHWVSSIMSKGATYPKSILFLHGLGALFIEWSLFMLKRILEWRRSSLHIKLLLVSYPLRMGED